MLLAIHTWTGAVDNNWSTPGNWNGGAPTSNESGGTVVAFNSIDSSVNQNIPNLTVQHVRFDAGSSITLTLISDLRINGGIEEVGPSTNTINGPGKTVITGIGMDVDVEGGVIIAADITGSFGLNKFGTGYLDLKGNSNYSAQTSVFDGKLLLEAPLPNAGVPQSLYIAQNGAEARVDSAEQINDAADVFIDSAGILALNGVSETIASLHVKDGFVNMFGQNPVLHLNGDVTSLASDSYGDIGGRLDFLGGQRKFIVADGLPTPDLIVSAVIQGSN